MRDRLAVFHDILEAYVLAEPLGDLVEFFLRGACLAVTSNESKREVIKLFLIRLNDFHLGLEVAFFLVVKRTHGRLVFGIEVLVVTLRLALINRLAVIPRA